MTVTVAPLFPTLLGIDTLPRAAEVNAVLAPAIKRAAGSGAWQGTLERTDPAVAAALDAVTSHITRLAERHTEDALSPQASRFRWAVRVRASAAPPHAAVEPLREWEAFWAASYFVQDGYAGSALRALAGEIVIEDPRLPMPMAEFSDLRLRTTLDPAAPAYEPEVQVRPAAGRLLMYPGWLRVRRRALAGGEPAYALSVALTAVRR